MAVSSTSDLTTALEDLTYGTTERKVNQRGSSELGKDEFKYKCEQFGWQRSYCTDN